MTESEKSTTYGIFGHYGNENLGDEAIIEAVIGNIKKRAPTAKIVCLSINPTDSAQRFNVTAYPIRNITTQRQTHAQQIKTYYENAQDHGVDSTHNVLVVKEAGLKAAIKKLPLAKPLIKLLTDFPSLWRDFVGELRFLKDAYAHMQEIDVLFITGSNQFLDNFGGTWGFPYTLLKWCILAKLTHSKIGILCVGAGPLDKMLSRIFVREIIKMSDYVSFRDQASRALIEKNGFISYAEVYPDLAHSLINAKIGQANITATATKSQLVVGINPMPVYDSRYWHETDPVKAQALYRAMGVLVSKIIKDGMAVFFFPTQPKDEFAIREIFKVVQAELQQTLDIEQYIKRPQSVSGLIDIYLSADLIIATRFHGVLLSLLCQRPVLGICYHRKSDDLLTAMGQLNYSVELDTLDADDAYQKFTKLCENRHIEIEKIKTTNQKYNNLLQQQYDILFKIFP